MNTLRLASVAFGLLLGGLSTVLAQEDKAIEGTWIAVSGQAEGKEVPPQELQGAEVIFADGKMTAKQDGKTVNVFAYKLNVATEPRSIDFEVIEGEEKGEKRFAIFEIRGEELKLCGSDDGKDGKERPTAFRTEKGKDWVLLIFKRKK